MQTASPWRAQLSFLISAFVFGFVLAMATALAWHRAVARGEHAAAPAPDVSVAGASAAPARAAEPDTPAPGREDATPPADVRTFEERVDELVRIGQRTAEFAQQDDTSAAASSDAEARAAFADLLTRFDDAGERALAMLIALAPPADEALTHGRCVVLQLVAKAECQRREPPAGTRDRTRVDAFVQAVLDTMPATAITAEAGDAVLTRQPYLRAVHEPTVLRLAQLASEQQFSRAIATRMLLTLWDNLQRFGERSSDELTRLALLLLDNQDASQRTVACRHLLTDARYRNLVVAWLRDHGDAAVVDEIAGIAAGELPVAEALDVLHDLGPTQGRMAAAFLTLGFRAPERVADRYHELLASNTNAEMRADLVTGVGMTNTPLGLEIAQLAMHDDPSPDVRVQAVFALTARRDAELGERALMQALDDREIASDPLRLGSMVFALQNLALAGDSNAVDRVAQRQRALPLRADSRQRLDAIVQRSLPGGRTSAPVGGNR
jgi:hypothetical protein